MELFGICKQTGTLYWTDEENRTGLMTLGNSKVSGITSGISNSRSNILTDRCGVSGFYSFTMSLWVTRVMAFVASRIEKYLQFLECIINYSKANGISLYSKNHNYIQTLNDLWSNLFSPHWSLMIPFNYTHCWHVVHRTNCPFFIFCHCNLSFLWEGGYFMRNRQKKVKYKADRHVSNMHST